MNLPKNAEWIYAAVPEETSFPELSKLIKDVEKALGFKLFYWQKYYILNEQYRQSGCTTAKILRELLLQTDKPIDYRYTPLSNSAKFYRDELLKTKKILNDAGVKTRQVLLKEPEKRTTDSGPRKCEVLGLPALFHQWVKNSDGDIYGLIEYENGVMGAISYKFVKFTDTPDLLKKVEDTSNGSGEN